MITKCAMCGRLTEPYAWIGAEALGPKCARRAGIVKGKASKGGRIRFADQRPAAPKERVPVTMDLFEELNKEEYLCTTSSSTSAITTRKPDA